MNSTVRKGLIYSPCRKYTGLFRIKFINSLQYRAAAAAGVCTQFAWGFMLILLYKTLYSSADTGLPMNFSELVNYVWLQQAFLALFRLWFWDSEISESVINGNIAYEFIKPMDLYSMWFVRTASDRCAQAFLRFSPILIIAFLLPKPYNFTLPDSLLSFVLFIITMLIGMLVVCALCMIVYILTFFTLSPTGIRIIASSVAELLGGAIIPLPFFPEKFRIIAEYSPFAAVENLPLRIYSGNISGSKMYLMIAVQIFWLFAAVTVGKLLMKKVMKRAVVQGG